MDDYMTALIAAILTRSRCGIQVSEAEMDDARAAIARGARVVLTATTKYGKGSEATYRLDLVGEGL